MTSHESAAESQPPAYSRAGAGPARSTYLVETYTAARATEPIGPLPDMENVRYRMSIAVPDDELCFHLFEAADAAYVRAACDELGIGVDRMVEVRTVG